MLSKVRGVTAVEGVFRDGLRRTGIAWVAVTVPLVVLGGWFIHGEGPYLVSWVAVSGLYTTPALVITWLAARRADPADQGIWRTWFVGLVFIYVVGCSILVLEATGWDLLRRGGAIAVAVGVVAYGTAIIMMMRSRSGSRALSIDYIEDHMGTTLFVAPLVLLFGDRIISSDAAWFAVPGALTAIALTLAFCSSISLFARLGQGRRIMEALGVTLAVVGVVNSMGNVAQAVSGFTLPAGPILGLQAISMGLVLLIPLHLPKHVPAGLDRLPPHLQVRGGGALALLTAVGVPVLLVETYTLKDEVSWAVPFTLVVIAILLGLSTLRHRLTTGETKKLYGQVERAAEDRRKLLADVMQRSDADRHRVATQLHEQAVSAYAAFVSLLGATQGAGAETATGDPLSSASALVRDDLARQAESLRQLMLAVRPIEFVPAGPHSLEPQIVAFADTLYGDRPTPALVIEVDEDLELDWTTETIVLRTIQEALRNVSRHAHATEVSVGVLVDGNVIDVTVEDNGIGFDPDRVLTGSGIAAMRGFARYHGGRLAIRSAEGQGTIVQARLGEAEPEGAGGEPTGVDGRGALPGGGTGRDDGARVMLDLTRLESGSTASTGRVGGPSPRPGPHLRIIDGGALSGAVG